MRPADGAGRLFENETDQDCYLKPGDTRVSGIGMDTSEDI